MFSIWHFQWPASRGGTLGGRPHAVWEPGREGLGAYGQPVVGRKERELLDTRPVSIKLGPTNRTVPTLV